ncbi:MAG: DUF4331 domain-containing protein [Armatimonadetes bacterium]|nr:DUF4331 domain-containing protein [Armatimonadota bacterium]
MKFRREALQSIASGVLAILVCAAYAASHSDAPLIKQDPQANITDVYAFIGSKYDNAATKVLNVIVHVRPFSEPGDGVMYERFADDALYSIHITNPATGTTLRRYNFRFSPVNPLSSPGLKNPDTILSYGLGTEVGPIATVGDARQNYTQAYTVQKVAGGATTAIGAGLLTAPPNVGLRTTPLYNDPTTGKAVSGAASFASLDSYTKQTVYSLSSGEAVFAGSREDGFYADTPGIFDLLDSRIITPSPPGSFGQNGGGMDDFKGFNVLAFAIQIPVDSLPSSDFNSFAFGTQTGVGVYASVSRPRITLRKSDGNPVHSGPWVQVNRMGNPLFNEALVALRDKDRYNRTGPTGDSAYVTYAQNPEVAKLINIVFFGSSDGSSPLVTTGRTDLQHIILGTGSGADVLRVNTTTAPVLLAGQGGFSRLSFIGGDTTTASGGPVPGGWPNGRRLGDDVVDVALTAVASGPAYSSITVVGDNVAANDQVYNQVFPYSATPHAGPRHSKDSGPNIEP